jgi:hypothetical protein
MWEVVVVVVEVVAVVIEVGGEEKSGWDVRREEARRNELLAINVGEGGFGDLVNQTSLRKKGWFTRSGIRGESADRIRQPH